MTVNVEKETADREERDPMERASEHALVRYVPGAKVNELDTSHGKNAINKFEHDPPSKQVVIAAVHAANCKRKDAEAALEIAESAAATARAVACSHRIELGRALIEARKLWPKSGPKSKGWAELLEVERLPRQTALDYMKLAGYVEKIPTPRRENTTYRNSGIKKDKKAPTLSDHLTSVLNDLETRLIEATDEEKQALVSALEKWLEGYR